MRFWLTLLAIIAASNAAGASERKQGRTSTPGARRGTAKPAQRDAKSSTAQGPVPHTHPRCRPVGEIQLIAYRQSWEGRVLTPKGHLVPSARESISRMLGATGSRPAVPDRLIHLLVSASDEFGGRPLRVVSGFRTSSYFQDSRHRQSAAIDFSIIGVRNAELRDYLLTLDQVGVGYYPNSSFVHLDVRPDKTYWIDYAGPGEPPRYHPRKTAIARTAVPNAPLEALPDQVPRLTELEVADARAPTSQRVQESVPDGTVDTGDKTQRRAERESTTVESPSPGSAD